MSDRHCSVILRAPSNVLDAGREKGNLKWKQNKYLFIGLSLSERETQSFYVILKIIIVLKCRIEYAHLFIDFFSFSRF
jgi:hypothetical protein